MANRLQAVRRASGFSQTLLAARMGVGKSSLRRWEQAELTPSLEMIERYAARCRLSGDVARWIGFGGKAPNKLIATELRFIEREVARREASKGAA